MTTDAHRIVLPRIVRDIRVISREGDDGGDREPQSFGGILRPFSGVLGLAPWRSTWPEPALSFLRLTPHIVPKLKAIESARAPSDASRSRRREGTPDDEAAPDSDADAPRVRDVLEKVAEESDALAVDRASAPDPLDLDVAEFGRDRRDQWPGVEGAGPSGDRSTGEVRRAPGRDRGDETTRPSRVTPPTGEDEGGQHSDEWAVLASHETPDSRTAPSDVTDRDVNTPAALESPGQGDFGPSSDIDRPPMEPLRGVAPTTDVGGASTQPSGGPGDTGAASLDRGSTRGSGDRRQGERRDSSPGDPSNGHTSGDVRAGDASNPSRQIDDIVDVDRLADRLARVFERKARIERERRGR